MIEENEEFMAKVEELVNEGMYDEEVAIAYVHIVGIEYADASDMDNAYQGRYYSDEDFAQSMAEELGLVVSDAQWPNNCIDWEQAAYELMSDYSEENSHYFRGI